MTKRGINFVKLLAPYIKGWVAVSDDFKRVVFYGKTLKETTKKAQKTDKKLFYFPTGETYSHFVGLS